MIRTRCLLPVWPGYRTVALGLAVIATAACAVAPPPRLPVASYPEKLGWILRLEDERRLREPAPDPTGAERDARPAPGAPSRDLIGLLHDPESRVRVRAALAVGRVGLTEGVSPLVERLGGDPEPAVRRMAAFALGLLGDQQAVPALLEALDDPGPLVWGRAAEALARLSAPEAAAPIGQRVGTCVDEGVLAGLDPDDVSYPIEAAVDACRFGLLALARLGAYAELAHAILDGAGQPRVRWWPVAYALSRTEAEDPRARAALLSLAQGSGTYTAAFAAKGLGLRRDAGAVETLVALADPRRSGTRVAVAAVQALARIGDAQATPALLELLRLPDVEPVLRVEVVRALGALREVAALDYLLDLLSHPWPPVRAAALEALADLDPDVFMAVLSGLDRDAHWSVRRTLAFTLGRLDRELVVPRLMQMLDDPDLRVRPAVLEALVQVGAPDVTRILQQSLESDDVVVRMAAARQLGRARLLDGVPALIAAWPASAGDVNHAARAAVLEGLAAFPDDPAAVDIIRSGLSDPVWAVRVRAAALLGEIDPTVDVEEAIRPAPRTGPLVTFDADELLSPAVSTQAYLETSHGVVQIELAVIDAPMTVQNFIALARQRFFDGLPVHHVVPNVAIQAGDPRGDGDGGPGYTIRDEINTLPFLRGTVGMASEWPDAGGSQFFITLGPQPHLDGRHTVFGRVTGGMDVVDQLREWDVIERVRIWDGVELTGQE